MNVRPSLRRTVDGASIRDLSSALEKFQVVYFVGVIMHRIRRRMVLILTTRSSPFL